MGENRKIYAALLGAGTVGSGVYKLAGMQEEDICLKTGAQLEIKKILVRNPGKVREGIPQELFTDSWQEILEDPEIQIVIEVMGGIEPARTYVEEAMKAGKQVVTANKDLLAEYGDPLFEIATENKCDLQFEAAVAGAIPIIRPLRQSLAGSQLTEIMGIVNGTTNYILDQMIRKGKTFETALKDAQNNGFAERNPAADIEGHDACRKIAILASLASGKMIDYNDIDTDGITNITLDDVKYAAAMDSVIKLIGYAQFDENGKVYSIVSPMVIKNSSPLAGVDGVFNAIMVTGDCVGDVMFYGKGAGKLPTASAVVADVVDAVKHSDRSKKIFWEKPAENIMADIDSKKFEYFVRTTDSAENVQKIFGKCEFVDNIIDNESAFVTSPLTKSEVEEKLAKLSDVVANIRVMD